MVAIILEGLILARFCLPCLHDHGRRNKNPAETERRPQNTESSLQPPWKEIRHNRPERWAAGFDCNGGLFVGAGDLGQRVSSSVSAQSAPLNNDTTATLITSVFCVLIV